MSFVGVEQAFAPLRKAREQLEAEAVALVKRDTINVMQMLMSITPVHSGETVRNFAVGSGGTKTPLGQQPPGKTNNLPLGSEPNRAANERAALSEIRTATEVRTLTSFVLTNNIDANKWGLVESGNIPGAPFKNRGPGGHTALAMQLLRNTGHWK